MADDDDKPVPSDDDAASGAEADDATAEGDPGEAPDVEGPADDDDVSDEAAASSSDADDAAARKEAAKQRALQEARAKAKAKAEGGEDKALATTTDAERRDLPKWNRARVKRKAPAGEETDAFQDNVRKAGRTAVSRAPLIVGAIALVGAGIGGWLWWRSNAEAKVAEQTKMLATAAAYQARGIVEPNVEALMADRTRPLPVPVAKDEAELAAKVDGALTGLSQTAPDSPANTIAGLIRASRHMRAGAFADAEAAYAAFLEGRPQHELAFLATEGILLAKEAQGDREGALAKADELVGEEPGAFYRDQALWHKGRLLEALDRVDDATAVYKQYAEEYPLEQESVAKDKVIERLRELAPDAVANLPAAPGGLAPGMFPPGVLGP